MGLRNFFLFLVLLALVLIAVDYKRSHEHDDDTYLQQLEHTLACTNWETYEDATFGYQMRHPSCFLPAEAEDEGSVRFVYVENLPLQQVQYMTLEVTTQVCSDTLDPYAEMRRRANKLNGACLRKSHDEYLMTAWIKSNNPQVTAYRMQSKYVLRQRMWFVQTLFYPEDFAPAVSPLIRELEQWKPFQ